ncbi:MAG: hypothetical protein EOM83_09610 [Clostridia bacterium]|nr:hypothetical protein [Clostridia bacterium]
MPMNNFEMKNLWPYLAAIVAFVALTLIYFSPLLEGQKLRQSDTDHWRGMSKEIVDYRAETGQEPLWTNSMFGGMPAYQISAIYKGTYLKFVDKILKLGLPHPASLVFLYFLGFFILLLILRVNPWLAVLGSIGFAFSSYFFIILDAGHNSKAHAIGYMAPVLGGIILAYRGKYLWGAALTALFLGLELSANHLQITYYLALIVFIFVIVQAVDSFRKKMLPGFVKASAVLLVAALLAVAANLPNIWATWEYGKYTIRGATELTSEQENRTSGLDIDYATQWSYGRAETFTLLMANFMGGASGAHPDENSATFDELKKVLPAQQATAYLPYFSLYWGSQPFTSGPVYAGAIMIFLFVLGLLVVPGKYKWWLLAATVLSILLAWGKNFMPFTEFFLHYMPGYNKFRAVSMTLVIAELTIPLLGVLALSAIFDKNMDRKRAMKQLFVATGITGGLLLLLLIIGGNAFSFSSAGDARLVEAGFPVSLIEALHVDRAALMRAEALRSLLFILLAAAMIWLALAKKMKAQFAFIGLILLVTIDMWTVNKRYLNDENFDAARKIEVPYTATQADKQILADKTPGFRVLNQTVSTFNDANTSYFHKSIGGYHGAKLRRYQELIDAHISKGNMKVLDMLNTRYFIVADQNKAPAARLNPGALGNAWIVGKYRLVDNADAEIAALNNFDPATEAIIDRQFANQLQDYRSGSDSAAAIKLTSYAPNELHYSFSSAKDELVVFSEIYYDKGWNVYVDDKPMPYLRANYVLRGMVVPSGQHEIVWKFEPAVYHTGGLVAAIFSIIILLGFFAALGNEMSGRGKIKTS